MVMISPRSPSIVFTREALVWRCTYGCSFQPQWFLIILYQVVWSLILMTPSSPVMFNARCFLKCFRDLAEMPENDAKIHILYRSEASSLSRASWLHQVLNGPTCIIVDFPQSAIPHFRWIDELLRSALYRTCSSGDHISFGRTNPLAWSLDARLC